MKKLLLAILLVFTLSGCDGNISPRATDLVDCKENGGTMIYTNDHNDMCIDNTVEDYYTKEEVETLLSHYNELLIMVWYDDTDDYDFIVEDGMIKETKISTGEIEYFTYDEFIEQVMEE